MLLSIVQSTDSLSANQSKMTDFVDKKKVFIYITNFNSN